MRVLERFASFHWSSRALLIVCVVGVAAGVAWIAGADVSQASLLLLVSVVFAASAGRMSGMFGAVLAALILNLAFTPPRWTLRVGTGDDTVALFTFAIVAVVVGTIVARLSELRVIADRRAAEADTAAKQQVLLEADASKARAEAEISRTRAGFISAVSHNLRTPLAAIQSSSDLLVSDYAVLSKSDRVAMLLTVQSETRRLRGLVDKVLDLGRIRAGGLDLAPESIDVEGTLQACVYRFRPLTRDRVVLVDVGEGADTCVVDPEAIEQILLNLVENVLQYTPAGTPFELVAIRERGVIEFRVIDHGPGVAVEVREKVFDEFFRADLRPESRGTGLGLAIVRALVAAHRGQVHAGETPGGGSTFVVRLPREYTDA